MLNRVAIIWVLYCCLLGFIGWLLHDFTLYQPLWVWIIGTCLFESFFMAGFILIASLLASIFFKNYTNLISDWAGVKESKTYAGDIFCFAVIVLMHIAMNVDMAYSLITSHA